MQVTNHYQFSSEEVITPFSYQIYDMLNRDDFRFPGEQRTSIDSIQGRTANYTEYDLFCFNSKLTARIQALNADLAHRLVPKEYQGRIFLFVELLYGAQNAPISKEMQQLLQTAVTECYTILPKKFLFLNAEQNIPMRGVVLPAFWLRSVLEKLILPEYINYNGLSIFSLAPELHEGNLYLALDADTNYNDDYNRLKLELLEYLRQLYVHGTIALTDDSPLIVDWSLTMLTPGLYRAQWQNFLFAKEKTPFLLRLALGGKEISLTITANEIVRHYIAKKLPFKHTFLADKLVVSVENLQEALRVSSTVTRALKHNEGEVAVLPVSVVEEKFLEGHDVVSYHRVDLGQVNSYLHI